MIIYLCVIMYDSNNLYIHEVIHEVMNPVIHLYDHIIKKKTISKKKLKSLSKQHLYKHL